MDSGPLIKQESISYIKEISFRSNDYALMKLISVTKAKVVESYSKGNSLILRSQNDLNSSQIRIAPGIIDYLQFRLKES